jgi:molybdenum cofactor biosynthesis enzyme MoaA
MVECPLKCTYCPQDQLRGTYGQNEKYLSFENFKLILSIRYEFADQRQLWRASRG